MFGDFSSETTEFFSCWRTEKKLRENGSQTSEILTYEVESQTVRPREAECQTESLLDVMKASGVLSGAVNYDENALQEFLTTVEPIVSKQLIINISAANLYTGIFKDRDGGSEISITCEQIVEEESVTSIAKPLEVTSLSWSSSGASVAVAYGTNENMAWSDSRCCICIWNLDRPKLKANSSDQKLEVESSIQTLAFHPVYPNYIAAGLFSGVVLLWDFVKDEVVYGSSSHEDPVTCMCWLEHKNAKYLQLLTGSTDGRLIVWHQRKGRAGAVMKIEKQFQILGANLPRRAGVKGSGAVGITCMSPARRDVGNVIKLSSSMPSLGVVTVGCENGLVLKCNTDADRNDPVTFVYDGHVGPVYSVDWSPFHRHLFLSCSSDQTCRIYHALQAAPLREIRPQEATGTSVANCLYSAFWSPTRPVVFFAAGTRGRVEACDVTTSHCVTFTDVNSADGKSCVVNTMQMNYKRPHLLATGSSVGTVHAWRLGSRLVEADDVIAEEIKALNEIADEAMASE